MPAGRERFGIAAANLCPAAAQRLHRAAEDAVPLAAGDDDRVAAQPPQRAARDQAIGPAADVDPVAAAILKCQPEQDHVRDVLQNHKRFGANAEGRRRLNRFDALGGDPVDHSGPAVEIPLARPTELAEDVQGVVPLALANAVGRTRRDREDLRARIDLGHFQVLVVPVPVPVTVQTDVGLVLPRTETVLGVVEGVALAEDLAGLDIAFLGPAGERLRRATAIQLGTAAKVGGVAEILDPQRLQIGFEHAATGRRIELLAEPDVGNRPPASDLQAAAEDGRFPRLGLVDDRRLRGPRVLRRQAERLLTRILSTVNQHAHAARGQRPVVRLLQRSYGVSCLLETGERPGFGAIGRGRGSRSGRCEIGNMEHDCRLGKLGELSPVPGRIRFGEVPLAQLGFEDQNASGSAMGFR